MELILKNVNPEDVSLLSDIAARLGIMVEKKGDDIYDPEFVGKIERSKKQAAAGDITVIAIDDLWK